MKLFTLLGNKVVYDNYPYKSKGVLNFNELDLVCCDRTLLENYFFEIYKNFSFYDFQFVITVMNDRKKNILIFENGRNLAWSFRHKTHLINFVKDHPILEINEISYTTHGIIINNEFSVVLLDPL
jgi:hypothetical protein